MINHDNARKRYLYLSLLPSISCANRPTEILPGLFALPGRVLSGEAGRSQSWSKVVQESGVLGLETGPADHYSVRVGFILKDDKIYFDPAEHREWNAIMKADPVVHVRFEGQINSATAVRASDTAELEGFAADRDVFRLDLNNGEN